MMNRNVSRRSVLGALMLSSSTLALAGAGASLKSLLQSSEGESKVRSILRKHFPLEGAGEQTITEFYQSLLLAKSHREDQKFFLDHLDNKELEERLEIYVIEEFIVSTNYMMILAGETTELRMLK